MIEMKPLYVKAGDTFFTRSSSVLGRLIRWGERDPGEEPTWANHTGVVVKDGWIGRAEGKGLHGESYDEPEAEVVEALWHVRKGPLKLNGTRVRVFRPNPPYTREEMERFLARAVESIGDRYGWWKLGGFLLKRLTRGVIDVTKWYFISSRPVCSYFAARVNNAARWNGKEWWTGGSQAFTVARWPGFGMPPSAADPDEMLDFCEAHPEWWTEVR